MSGTLFELQYCSNRTILKYFRQIFTAILFSLFELSQKASCKIVLDKLIYEGVFEHLKRSDTLNEMRVIVKKALANFCQST